MPSEFYEFDPKKSVSIETLKAVLTVFLKGSCFTSSEIELIKTYIKDKNEQKELLKHFSKVK